MVAPVPRGCQPEENLEMFCVAGAGNRTPPDATSSEEYTARALTDPPSVVERGSHAEPFHRNRSPGWRSTPAAIRFV
jgi:hypothetical protein